MATVPPPFNTECVGNALQSLLRLDTALWLDLEGGLLIREQQEILLTARELAVLQILVRNMFASRGYLSATALAKQIRLEAYDPEHSIEQTVSLLRRKMGEKPHHPRILRGRRGLGYRLFPEFTSLQVPSSH